jgi:hypothetical protein
VHRALRSRINIIYFPDASNQFAKECLALDLPISRTAFAENDGFALRMAVGIGRAGIWSSAIARWFEGLFALSAKL